MERFDAWIGDQANRHGALGNEGQRRERSRRRFHISILGNSPNTVVCQFWEKCRGLLKPHFVTEKFRLFHLTYLVNATMSPNTGVRHSDCCGQAVRYHLPDRLSWALRHRLVDSHHYGGHAGIRPGHIHFRVGITLRIQHETPAFQKRPPVLTLQDLLAGLRSPFPSICQSWLSQGAHSKVLFHPVFADH